MNGDMANDFTDQGLDQLGHFEAYLEENYLTIPGADMAGLVWGTGYEQQPSGVTIPLSIGELFRGQDRRSKPASTGGGGASCPVSQPVSHGCLEQDYPRSPIIDMKDLKLDARPSSHESQHYRAEPHHATREPFIEDVKTRDKDIEIMGAAVLTPSPTERGGSIDGHSGGMATSAPKNNVACIDTCSGARADLLKSIEDKVTNRPVR